MSLEASLKAFIADIVAEVHGGGAKSADAPAKGPGRPKKDTTEATATAAPTIAVKTVADAVVSLAATNRTAAIAILAEYGVKQCSQLKPADYAAVLAKVAAAPATPEAPATDPLA